jgi:hypothetical protein
MIQWQKNQESKKFKLIPKTFSTKDDFQKTPLQRLNRGGRSSSTYCIFLVKVRLFVVSVHHLEIKYFV